MQSQNKIQSQQDRYKKEKQRKPPLLPIKTRPPARWYALRKRYHAKTEPPFHREKS